MSAYERIRKGLEEALELSEEMEYDDGIVNEKMVDKLPWGPGDDIFVAANQVGGDHYSNFEIQPLDFAMANQLDACQSKIVKYILRHEFKNGKEDLLKARDVLDKMIEFYYGGADES